MSVDHYCPGAPYARMFRWPIPPAIASDYHAQFEIAASISRPYAALEKTYTELLVRIKGPNTAGSPPLIGFAHRFDSADGLEPEKWRKVKYTLGRTRFIGKENGTVTFWFNSLSLSTGPTLYVSEYHLAGRWGGYTEGISIV